MENGVLFKELLQTPNFRITVVDDADTVELCGALKVSISHVSMLRGDISIQTPEMLGLRGHESACTAELIR